MLAKEKAAVPVGREGALSFALPAPPAVGQTVVVNPAWLLAVGHDEGETIAVALISYPSHNSRFKPTDDDWIGSLQRDIIALSRHLPFLYNASIPNEFQTI